MLFVLNWKSEKEKKPLTDKQPKDLSHTPTRTPIGKAAVDRESNVTISIWTEVKEAIDQLRERHESRGSVVHRAIIELVKLNKRKVSSITRRELGMKG